MKQGQLVVYAGFLIMVLFTIIEYVENGPIIISNIEFVILGLILVIFGILELIANKFEELCK